MSTPSTLDFDRLLAPISGESPTGADLRADDSPESSYWLVRGARNDSSQIERKHADQPDVDDFSLAKCQWDVVVEKALAALSTESKDYEVAAWLCEALVREKGFAGLRDGLRLAREMAERYWESLYPRPYDGEIAPRVSQFRAILGKTLVFPILQVPITERGECSSLDWEQAGELERLGDAKEREHRIGRGQRTLQQVEQAARESSNEFYRHLIADVEEALSEAEQLSAVLAEKCKSYSDAAEATPSPREVSGALSRCRTAIRALVGDRLAAAEAPQAAAEEGSDGASREGGAAAREGGAMTREIAFQRLRELAEFFRKAEPHSPIADHIEEAVRWGQLSLRDLLAELIPNESARQEAFTRIGIDKPEQKPG